MSGLPARAARTRGRAAAWVAALACAASCAWGAGDSAPTAASAATWGTRIASAPPTAPGDDPDRANGDYFHDFAALMVRVRSVGWLAEICAETFPADAELDRRAYADWLHAHRAFVDEMEGQFDLLERRWAAAPPGRRASAAATAELRTQLGANRAALRSDFLARPRALQQRRCQAYPGLLPTRAFDLEVTQADLVRTVRRGPPP